jgi:hypothetical protein
MQIYIRSGEFNTNWFEAVKAPVTGLQTQQMNDINIYPNPANTVVTIETNQTKGRQLVSIYNTSGQMVKQSEVSESGMVRIDISDLRKGFYLVEIKNENGEAQTAKLFVQ